jgi:hypothetical protein
LGFNNGTLGQFVDLLKSIVMRWLDLAGWWVKPLTDKSPSEWLSTGAEEGKKAIEESSKWRPDWWPRGEDPAPEKDPYRPPFIGDPRKNVVPPDKSSFLNQYFGGSQYAGFGGNQYAAFGGGATTVGGNQFAAIGGAVLCSAVMDTESINSDPAAIRCLVPVAPPILHLAAINLRHSAVAATALVSEAISLHSAATALATMDLRQVITTRHLAADNLRRLAAAIELLPSLAVHPSTAVL